MKKLFLAAVLCLLSNLSFAQSEVDSLINSGSWMITGRDFQVEDPNMSGKVDFLLGDERKNFFVVINEKAFIHMLCSFGSEVWYNEVKYDTWDVAWLYKDMETGWQEDGYMESFEKKRLKKGGYDIRITPKDVFGIHSIVVNIGKKGNATVSIYVKTVLRGTLRPLNLSEVDIFAPRRIELK